MEIEEERLSLRDALVGWLEESWDGLHASEQARVGDGAASTALLISSSAELSGAIGGRMIKLAR